MDIMHAISNDVEGFVEYSKIQREFFRELLELMGGGYLLFDENDVTGTLLLAVQDIDYNVSSSRLYRAIDILLIDSWLLWDQTQRE